MGKKFSEAKREKALARKSREKRKKRERAKGGGEAKIDKSNEAKAREVIPTSSSSTIEKKATAKKGKSEANGKALPTPSIGINDCRFLTPSHAKFQEVVDRSYVGFVHEPAAALDFHDDARQCLQQLEDRGYYQYDVVQAGGKGLSRTFVRRTLVGNPGITYKYLRLRLFAHSWDEEEECLAGIKRLNESMRARTRAQQGALGIEGSCDYNLTLINYMEPDHPKLGLKQDPMYGMGTVSVSWHCDSSLQDFSAIGVYHLIDDREVTLAATNGGKQANSPKCDWRIAMRITPEAEAKGAVAPPVVVPTESGDAYFLMGNFNIHHQHAVLSGSLPRYSSTHRVAVEEKDTLQYIEGRVDGLALPPIREATPNDVNQEQRVLDELEFEWLRHYWIQGEAHDRIRKFWQQPIRRLEAKWAKLELRTKEFLDCEREGLSRSVRAVILEALRKRRRLREQWKERQEDKIYRRRIEPEYRPVTDRPKFMPHSLSEDLSAAIEKLAKVIASQPKPSKSKKGKGKQADCGGAVTDNVFACIKREGPKPRPNPRARKRRRQEGGVR
jgi:alpha-ketoglutarate-dependent dioxygenase FTO